MSAHFILLFYYFGTSMLGSRIIIRLSKQSLVKRPVCLKTVKIHCTTATNANETINNKCNIRVHTSKNRQMPRSKTKSRSDRQKTLVNIKVSNPVDVARPLSVALLNARSVNNKALYIFDFIVDRSLDILAITETWLRDNTSDSAVLSAMVPAGYSIVNVPRGTGVSGGVAVIYRSNISASQRRSKSYKSFEHVVLDFKILSNRIKLIVVYSPTPKTGNSQASEQIIAEFGELLDKIAVSPGKMLVVGDLNYHVNDTSDPIAKRFLGFLSASNVHQHVQQVTHEGGHTLDLVMTRCGELPLCNLKIDHTFPSDHMAVVFLVLIEKPPSVKKRISFRKWKSIDTE